MANTVLQCTAVKINEMKAFYKTNLQDKMPPGSVFTAKVPGCTITAYRSGKVLFQGGNGQDEAGKWGTAQDSAPSKSGKPKTNPKLPANIAEMSLIGSDEVGTGDFFGPITVVAAYVKKEQIPLLKELGVRDSKNLTDEKIIAIAKDLVSVIPYSLLICHNPKYNDLQEQGMSQGKIKALLHNRAILNLLQKISPEDPEAILIDQFAEESTYYKYLAGQKEIHREKVLFSTKGESIHLSVAAASILARYAFVKEMDKLSSAAGFTLPKGAGKQVDIAGAKIIRKHGTAELKKLTKWHFANSDKAQKLARG
ncbi:ribonuclease HIII [Bacillus salacetis]|uniref:Ribonuclease HIII n=1 Tax=Bacillus salacetis TaxID=2315464 RepID=A0A3A1R4S8_9BACI|nr:ribonuclease HIII [Bacillus salacetis]RIW37755.1 ribonuclease HIII [Bacillus salacetis]